MLSDEEYVMLQGIVNRDYAGNLAITGQLRSRGILTVDVSPVMARLVLTQKGIQVMRSYEANQTTKEYTK